MTDLPEKQARKLKEFREKEAEDLAQILSEKYGLPYADLSTMTIDIDALKLIEEPDAREGQIASFQSVGKRIQIAVRNPDALKTKNILADLTRQGYTPELFVVSENSLKRAWDRYKEVPEFIEVSRGLVDISPEHLEEFQEKVINVIGFQSLLKEVVSAKESRRVSKVVEIMLAGALKLEASDIHIEPREEKTRMRLRLDGVLQDIILLDNQIYQLMLSRIKLVSELKLNIHDKSQDGRFTIRTKETDIEVRTSILPGPFGESIVLRILHPKAIAMTMSDLGMQKSFEEILGKELKRPNGMILTTGPTGSGKTTTLYAYVKQVRKPGIKIVTIEDPIEYHLKGITQTQVNKDKGYDFSNGLRAILRQDPDIILVGEIRDLETAEIAMHAALTGHLVFSTLHTNNAAGTIPRLIDLGVKPAIIAPAINVSMAQRLVRKLCEFCKKEDSPKKEELKRIQQVLKNIPSSHKQPDIKKIKVWRANKCEKCSETGYKGRIGIFEAFLTDDEVESLILKSPSEAQMRQVMERQQMLTMFQDGILKVLEGITTLEELERVAEEN